MRAQKVLREGVDALGVLDGLDCLVAVEGAAIIGVVVFEPCDERGFGVIRSIGVAMSKQNFGIATDLKRQVLDNCSAAGASKVLSEVHRNNVKMQRVNEKLGIPSIPNPIDGKFRFYSALLIAEDDDPETPDGAANPDLP